MSTAIRQRSVRLRRRANPSQGVRLSQPCDSLEARLPVSGALGISSHADLLYRDFGTTEVAHPSLVVDLPASLGPGGAPRSASGSVQTQPMVGGPLEYHAQRTVDAQFIQKNWETRASPADPSAHLHSHTCQLLDLAVAQEMNTGLGATEVYTSAMDSRSLEASTSYLSRDIGRPWIALVSLIPNGGAIQVPTAHIGIASSKTGSLPSGLSRWTTPRSGNEMGMAQRPHAQREFMSPSDEGMSELSFSSSEPMAEWLRAVFDNGVWTSGLDFKFERDAAIETMLQTWEPNEPRFGEPMGIQEFAGTYTVIPSTHGMDVLGSGWHLDGHTPVICIVNEGLYRLDWYSGPDWTLLRRQTMGPTRDLLGGAVPGKHYRPVSGIIHEGLHVMKTERWDVASQQVDGLGFFYTQNFGQSWTEVPNLNPDIVPGIASHPDALGISRGARWSFANAFPNGDMLSQTDAWFPWGDYLKKTGSPKGGQVGLFRATRLFVGATWTVHPNRVIWDRWEPSDSGGLHAHGATVHPNAGVVLSWWGDVGYRNEIVVHKFTNLDQYTTSEMTTHRQGHGGYDPTGANYLYSNQAAGFAPGPEYGSALASADENPERLVVASVDPVTLKVKLEPLIASSTNDTSGAGFRERTCLWIHYVRDRGYVLREIGTTGTGNDNRTWVSENGRTWTKIMAKSGGTPVIFGNLIAFSSPTGKGVSARPWAPVHSLQPLLISPGGWNRQFTELPQRTAPAAGNTVREVYIDVQGQYRYHDTQALLEPQPAHHPPVSPLAPMVEITVTQQRNAGNRWLMAPGETDDFSIRHYWMGWVYPLEPLGLRPTYRLGGPQTGNQTGERGPSMKSTDHWVPTYHFGETSNSTPSRGTLSLLQMHTGTNRWLLASQSLTAGYHPPYPLHPGQQGSDELATISGISVKPTWTASLSLALPSVGFDAWHSNGALSMTLATIWANPTNYLEIRYIRNLRYLEVRLVNQGTIVSQAWTPGVWLSKEDRVDIVVSSNGTRTEVTYSLPQNGAHPVNQSATVLGTVGEVSEIRLSNHNRTEVVPLQWLAVNVHPYQYYSLNERIELLSSIDFLSRPT